MLLDEAASQVLQSAKATSLLTVHSVVNLLHGTLFKAATAALSLRRSLLTLSANMQSTLLLLFQYATFFFCIKRFLHFRVAVGLSAWPSPMAQGFRGNSSVGGPQATVLINC